MGAANGHGVHAPAPPSPPPIPLIYRILMLYVEPFFAANAAYLLTCKPAKFMDAVSPHHPLPSSPSEPASTDSVRLLTDMLAAVYLVFAFNLAVVLRVAGRDRRMWRVMCAGMLLSDLTHIAATVREFGGLVAMADLSAWRSLDWVNICILLGMGTSRACVVLGVGLG